MGKRIHLCKFETGSLADGLNNLFKRKVEIPRIKHGKKQTLETLINEEGLLLAKYLRKENEILKTKKLTHKQKQIHIKFLSINSRAHRLFIGLGRR